jgi:hypothetical protein
VTGQEVMERVAARMGATLDGCGWWECERMATTAGYVRRARAWMVVERPGCAGWLYEDRRGVVRHAQGSVSLQLMGGGSYRVTLSSPGSADALRAMWAADNPGASPDAPARGPKPRPELRALWGLGDAGDTGAGRESYLLALTGRAGTKIAMAWRVEHQARPDGMGPEAILESVRDTLAKGGGWGQIGRWPAVMQRLKPTLADVAELMDEGRSMFGVNRSGAGPMERKLVRTLMAPDPKLAELLRRKLRARKLAGL